MIVIASANGSVGIEDAMRTLRNGGSALDAVEAGIRPVESNPDDHTVGYSGLPNLLGEVEVDASIMDGLTLRAGAVGAVRNCEHAIALARKVMEELPHVLLVGAGAERFAREMGFPERDLLTDEAREIWREIFDAKVPSVYRDRLAYVDDMRRYAKLAADPERPNETVNFIARDAEGNLAAGASTSGWSWKYPGRVGDSPVVGAGNYADNRYGAAACTGRGEMAMRLCTAHSVAMYLKMGMGLEAAGREAIADLGYLVDPYFGRVSLLAMDARGNHAGFSSAPEVTYIYMTDDMSAYAEAPRMHVAIGEGRRV
ncbi:MAG: asparaginase [Zetaproteobacteria bacterium]|nr:MAG: asparaginase [Zetaproteobacteria bacterium]